ncbi:peptidylprolyl isomerase fpr3 [Rhodotorula toruloides]
MAQPLILGLWSIVLEPGKTYSQNTSPAIQITNVSYGAEVKGNARSAVTMKYPEFEQDSDDEEDDEEEEDEDEDDENIKLPKIITKEPVLAVLRPNADVEVVDQVTLVEDVEVVEFSVTGENPVHLVGHYVRQEDFDQPPSDYDSEEEYGSDFDDEDDFDSEGMSGLIDDDEEDDEDMEDAADRIQEIEEPKKAASKKRPADETPAGADDSTVSAASVAGLSKNQKKKLAKKQKAENGEAVAPAAEEKKAAEPKKAEAKKDEPKKDTRKTQVLAGGLEITDFKEGTGPAAKAGSKVGMRYIGKLDNGKVFDSNTKGAPLVFNLGRGQVIKGWDLGVVGMKVGGERKLVIPAALAYGKQKIPGIPPNSRLTFDVKLLSLSPSSSSSSSSRR